MSEDHEEEQSVKVVDRRRMTAEDDSNAIQEKEITSKPEDVTTDSKEQAPKVDSKTASADQGAQEQSAEGNFKNQNESLDYSSFLVSLATQALVMLGAAPAPDGTQVKVNLDAARQTIDIIGLLAEKTKGNLTDEETKLQQEILTSLRIAFVNKTNGQ